MPTLGFYWESSNFRPSSTFVYVRKGRGSEIPPLLEVLSPSNSVVFGLVDWARFGLGAAEEPAKSRDLRA